jgi:hypothetical protein
MVAFVIDKNLRFILQAAKGATVNDAVAVALEWCAMHTFGFFENPAPALVRPAGINRQRQSTVIVGGLVQSCCHTGTLYASTTIENPPGKPI